MNDPASHNPITSAAYSLNNVAEYLGLEPQVLRNKISDYPECYPPHTIVGRTKKHDGAIVFPVRLFEKWLEENAIVSQMTSSESAGYAAY